MTTEREQYLLDRCIRLEARLLGIALPNEPAPCAPPVRQRRAITPDEITQMRALRKRGLPYDAIGHRLSRSSWVVRRYAGDVEREMISEGYGE